MLLTTLVIGKHITAISSFSFSSHRYLAGGVLDSLFLDYNSVKKLEKMPTKLELIRDAAIMIKKVRSRQSNAAAFGRRKI